MCSLMDQCTVGIRSPLIVGPWHTGVARGLVVAVGVDADEPVFVELLPQAANSTRAPKIRRQNMAYALGLDVLMLLCIFSLS